MKDAMWEEVAPYLVHERQTHEEGELRAERIAEFLRLDQRCEPIEIILRGSHASGWEVGSCTQFFIYLDDKWSLLPADRFAAKHHRYRLEIAVSERGPFIVSSGSEWLPSPSGGTSGGERFEPRESFEAAAKAKGLALAIARRFDLTYLDAEWLRQIKLNPKELPDEVLLSLDYSEPDALNVLFDETV